MATRAHLRPLTPTHTHSRPPPPSPARLSPSALQDACGSDVDVAAGGPPAIAIDSLRHLRAPRPTTLLPEVELTRALGVPLARVDVVLDPHVPGKHVQRGCVKHCLVERCLVQHPRRPCTHVALLARRQRARGAGGQQLLLRCWRAGRGTHFLDSKNLCTSSVTSDSCLGAAPFLAAAFSARMANMSARGCAQRRQQAAHANHVVTHCAPPRRRRPSQSHAVATQPRALPAPTLSVRTLVHSPLSLSSRTPRPNDQASPRVWSSPRARAQGRQCCSGRAPRAAHAHARGLPARCTQCRCAKVAHESIMPPHVLHYQI